MIDDDLHAFPQERAAAPPAGTMRPWCVVTLRKIQGCWFAPRCLWYALEFQSEQLGKNNCYNQCHSPKPFLNPFVPKDIS
ncbi:MAG: hypothetical protein IPN37_02185 [Betaproteobacteria bacterium]|nr:hypothetical protein [Betaproteobacteria bacterium]